MRSFDDCPHIDTKGAPKRDVRDCHKTGCFVYLSEQALEGYDDAIIGRHNLNLCPEPFLSVPDVLHRRKIKRGSDNLIAPRVSELETRYDTGQSYGCVWLYLHRAGRAAQDACDAIACQLREFPPTRSPGVFTRVMLPGVAIVDHRFAGGAGHRAQ